MIFGRPSNLWLGLVTAGVGFLTVIAVTVFHLDPIAVATVAGAGTGLLGAVVALVAGQPPTVKAGDTVNVATPQGEDDYSISA